MSNPSLVSLSCVPSPAVAQAVDNVLILKKPDDSAGVTVEVARWPFMVVNQKATLHVCGQQADGSPVMLRVADAEPVTQHEFQEGWRRNIAWTALQNLKDGSHIAFVFQVALDGCSCACPVLFPTLSLKVRHPFEELTTFENGNWNDWEKGDAIKDSRDLQVANREGTWCLENMTYSPNSSGIVVFKTINHLEVDRCYEFGLSVRRLNGADPVPRLSLETSSGAVTEETQITDLSWHTLKGTFKADASSMQLRIKSHESDTRIRGNDYGLTRILVREL